ncbi:MAG: ABC transporter ATP-binding protein [Acidobacteria bacterium]|nr:ABC transporter ATP-binding protein [Acidobacteriota bacterium]
MSLAGGPIPEARSGDDAVVLRGVAKRYPGFALEDVSLRLPRGAILGLVGPNGAGKTTLIRILLALARRDAGEVKIFGLDPAVRETEVKSRVGFVHESPPFPPFLSLEAIRSMLAPVYRRWDEARFRSLTREFGLPMKRRFGALSRGMKTQFALAVALSHRAELLVLDEPTTGLDPATRRRFLDLLLEVLQDEQCAVFFSTHLTADLDRVADYVTLLQGGKVALSTSVESFRDTWGLVRGGLDVLDGREGGLLVGCRRHPHGFEALTPDTAEARRRFGPGTVVDRATLEDLVVFTSAEHREAL